MAKITATVEVPDDEIDALISASWQSALSRLVVDDGACNVHVFEDDHTFDANIVNLAEKLAVDIRERRPGDDRFYKEQATVSIERLREAADVIEAAMLQYLK